MHLLVVSGKPRQSHSFATWGAACGLLAIGPSSWALSLGRPYSVWLPIPHGRISGWRGLHQDLHSHGGYVCLGESAALGDFLGKALTTFQQLQVQEAS